MDKDIAIVSLILFVTALLFIVNRLRSDLVAILAMMAIMLSGVLTVEESLAGFADPVIFIIISMFIVSEALVSTGIARRIGDVVLRAGRGSESRLILVLMVIVVSAGAFMSSTAVVAIFIPVTLMITDTTGFNRKRLLMPLSVAALISGMTTLIATAPNLVVTQALTSRGLEPLGFFSFAPFGAAVLLTSALFMVALGRHMLASKKKIASSKKVRTIDDLTREYGLAERAHLLGVPPGATLINLATVRIPMRQEFGLELVALERGRPGHRIYVPAAPEIVFAIGDELLVFGEDSQVERFSKQYGLEVLAMEWARPERSKAVKQELGLAEIMLSPESKFIGKRLAESQIRSRYQTNVLGLRRRSKSMTEGLQSLTLEFGDVLLVNGTWDNIARLREEDQHFVLLGLPEDYKEVAPARNKTPLALTIISLMVLTMITGLVPTVSSALMAALALVLTGCVQPDKVYRVISWSSIVMIAAMIPLATALDKSGATHLLSLQLVERLGAMGPFAMLASIFLVTALLSLFISNTATAILIAPVAIDTAVTLGVAPQAFAMTVAIACSAAFVTPVSSPVNMLVLEPGGYSFMDFVKVGIPLLLLAMLASITLAGLLYL